jgi:hypothetical protein
MDSLRELFNSVGPHMPFMMAVTPGKVKFNGTRIAEIMIVLAFLWHGFEGMKVELKEMKEHDKQSTIEFKQDQAETKQRLGQLEDTVEKIEKVVFKPISYREVDPKRVKFD